MRVVIIGVLVLFANATAAADPERGCRPLETATPNAPAQEPAFPGQTRACGVDSGVTLQVTVLADGLVHPWAVEPLPGGDLLVTERAGRMRIVSANGTVGEPLIGIPPVAAKGQGGLLDVALGPGFENDRTIFWSYTEPRQEGNGTSVARGVLRRDANSVEDVEVIFRALPAYANTMHYGSRVAFGGDGMLYVTLGERFEMSTRKQAQSLDSHFGKVVRIRPDGSVPGDNPFVDRENALPETWTLGHRNVQAAAVDENGDVWVIEHGAQGGDEVNPLRKGGNYGWPVVAYGEMYSGEPLPDAKTARRGFTAPVYYWDPVIGPSGATFYSADAIPEWRGSLLIGGLVERELVRLVLEDGKVIGEEHFLGDRNRRIRDVKPGRDGALYIVTDHADGELWRVTRAARPQPGRDSQRP